METRYQIIGAANTPMQGQPVCALAFMDREAAEQIAQKMTTATGMVLEVLQLQVVKRTTSLMLT